MAYPIEMGIHKYDAEHKGTVVVERSWQGHTVMAMLLTADFNMAVKISKKCKFRQVQYETGLFLASARSRWMICWDLIHT